MLPDETRFGVRNDRWHPPENALGGELENGRGVGVRGADGPSVGLRRGGTFQGRVQAANARSPRSPRWPRERGPEPEHRRGADPAQQRLYNLGVASIIQTMARKINGDGSEPSTLARTTNAIRGTQAQNHMIRHDSGVQPSPFPQPLQAKVHLSVSVGAAFAGGGEVTGTRGGRGSEKMPVRAVTSIRLSRSRSTASPKLTRVGGS